MTYTAVGPINSLKISAEIEATKKTEQLERYKLAAEKLRFLVYLWLDEDCGCTCSQCEELLADAEELWNGKETT